MAIPKKNIKKVARKAIKPIKKKLKSPESNVDEREIQNALAVFDNEMRKEFEKTLEAQKKLLETKLRGQIPEYRFGNENYRISHVVRSSRIPQPIFGFVFDVDSSFNEFVYAQSLEKAASDIPNSDKFKDVQKKLYYKLRLQGVKPADIYPQIEVNWAKMNKKEKDNFRSKMRVDFIRKKKRQEENKNGELLPSSECK